MRAPFRASVSLALCSSVLIGTLSPRDAQAQAAAPAAPVKPEAARAEARSRFERGLRAFDSGDLPGALAEFNRAQELLPNPNVLFNVAQVYAAMGKPVEATRIAKQIVADPSGLAPKSLEGAKKILAEQQSRVATVELKVNVPDAHIEVDNVDVARSPLKEPLQLASGTHVIGVFATGYGPTRKEITVAGETSTKLAIDLVPMEGKLAHLKLTATLLDAQLLANGEVIGTTPFPASLTLSPGKYHLELKRPGYTSQPVDVTLGDGATGEVTLAWQEDPGAQVPRGLLSLHVSEPNSALYVDGVRRGTYTAPVSLPAGRHRIRVERDGFFPAERDVILEGNKERTISLYLAPTNETRRAYVDKTSFRRTLGFTTLGAGAAVTVGAGVFFAINRGSLGDANKNYDAVLGASPTCATAAGPNGESPPSPAVCLGRLDDATNNQRKYQTRQTISLIGGGVGLVAVAAGVVLLVTNDDPHKYDREPASAKAKWITPVAYGAPGSGYFGVAGAF